MRKSTVLSAILYTVGILSEACTTIHLAKTWKDDTYTSTPFRKIMVLGGFKRIVNRQNMESAMVRELTQAGTEAESSLAYISGGKGVTPLLMQDNMASDGFDGVLTFSLLRYEHFSYDSGAELQPAVYSPGGMAPEPIFVRQRGGGQSGGGRSGPKTARLVTIEAALRSFKTNRVVWKAELNLDQDYLTEDGLTDDSAKESETIAQLVRTALQKDTMLSAR